MRLPAAARANRDIMRCILAFLCLNVVAFSAERPGQADIDYLLGYIAASDCRFIRNGKEYGAKEAADHLRDKLSKAGNRVQSADDFIDGVASKSYLTGRQYQIKTTDGKVVPTGPWLREALSRHRKSTR